MNRVQERPCAGRLAIQCELSPTFQSCGISLPRPVNAAVQPGPGFSPGHTGHSFNGKLSLISSRKFPGGRRGKFFGSEDRNCGATALQCRSEGGKIAPGESNHRGNPSTAACLPLLRSTRDYLREPAAFPIFCFTRPDFHGMGFGAVSCWFTGGIKGAMYARFKFRNKDSRPELKNGIPQYGIPLEGCSSELAPLRWNKLIKCDEKCIPFFSFEDTSFP